MALKGIELEAKLVKDAARLYVFSGNLPQDENPYRFKAQYLVGALNDNAAVIIANQKRSKFAADFIPSVVEQFNTKGFLSNKQLEIVENLLANNGFASVVEALLAQAKAEADSALETIILAHALEVQEFLPQARANYDAYRRQYAAQFRRGYRR